MFKMDVFNVAHWRQTLRSRIATSGAKQTQYVKVDGSTAQKMEEKLKSLASVLKSWQGKKRFHDFFYTSQRDMHPFLSVKIFCRSEGEAMLNKIQNLIHVEGKSFFFSTGCEEETALICSTHCLLTDFCFLIIFWNENSTQWKATLKTLWNL